MYPPLGALILALRIPRSNMPLSSVKSASRSTSVSNEITMASSSLRITRVLDGSQHVLLASGSVQQQPQRDGHGHFSRKERNLLLVPVLVYLEIVLVQVHDHALVFVAHGRKQVHQVHFRLDHWSLRLSLSLTLLSLWQCRYCQQKCCSAGQQLPARIFADFHLRLHESHSFPVSLKVCSWCGKLHPVPVSPVTMQPRPLRDASNARQVHRPLSPRKVWPDHDELSTKNPLFGRRLVFLLHAHSAIGARACPASGPGAGYFPEASGARPHSRYHQRRRRSRNRQGPQRQSGPRPPQGRIPRLRGQRRTGNHPPLRRRRPSLHGHPH